MAASTAGWGTGWLAVVTIGSTTYSKAKYFTLPKPTSKTVKIEHLGGLDKQPDGRDDFGKIVVEIPEDFAARLVDSNSATTPGYFAVSVACVQGPMSGHTCAATSTYCISDGGGGLKRGDGTSRMLEFDLLQDAVWT